MVALSLVRLIEKHSEELSNGLLAKFATSPRTADLHKVPAEELRKRTVEIFQNLSDWLLTKTGSDIEQRYFEIGQRRAQQGVSVSDFCWGIVLTKDHVWEFLQQQGFLRREAEISGELELLRLLDQFFDRAMCFGTEGYEHHLRTHSKDYASAGQNHVTQ
jgi:hypothetical protein